MSEKEPRKRKTRLRIIQPQNVQEAHNESVQENPSFINERNPIFIGLHDQKVEPKQDLWAPVIGQLQKELDGSLGEADPATAESIEKALRAARKVRDHIPPKNSGLLIWKKR